MEIHGETRGGLCCSQQSLEKLSVIAEYFGCGKLELALGFYSQLQGLDIIQIPRPIFVAALKACATLRDLKRGQEIHASISKMGSISRDPFVGCALVNMYARCGSLTRAHKVFDEFAIRDVVFWNSLIAGYVEHNGGTEGLQCFQQMQLEGVSPSHVTYISSLKACGILEDDTKGSRIHARIGHDLLQKDSLIGTSLVDMYAKCGQPAKAHAAFDMLPVRNVISWTALLAGFVENGYAKSALETFERMQIEGISPNTVTLICALKACSHTGDSTMGQELHMDVIRKGLLERDTVISNALIDMYAKCGELETAQEVFDRYPLRDTVSWNVLIMGYSEQGNAESVLECFQKMQLEDALPDAITFISLLKAISLTRAGNEGMKIVSKIEQMGLLRADVNVGNGIIDMFAKCGMIDKAQDVFDKLPVKDVVSWNALMSGYAERGDGKEALLCFSQMQHGGVPPDSCSFLCILKACGNARDKDKVEEMHSEIEKKGLIEKDLVLGNALVDTYAELGCLSSAQNVFDMLPVRSVVTWNALISGYVGHGCGDRALDCFIEMGLEGIFPDDITFVCVLKACGSTGAEVMGREIHAEIARKGLSRRHATIWNALLDMYAKCGLPTLAQEVFEHIEIRDIITWNSLISSYAECGYGSKALVCFRQMQLEPIVPDSIAFIYALMACHSVGNLGTGQDIHADIVRQGICETDLHIGSSLTCMYAKCGMLAEADQTLMDLPHRDTTSWNALISGYIEHECPEAAVECLNRMWHDGICPDEVTFFCGLKACGDSGARIQGEDLHSAIVKTSSLERETTVANNLIDMYGKFGFLDAAENVFDRLPVRDTGSWNALMSGYERLGDSASVLKKLEMMKWAGMGPDTVTCLIVLNACRHRCLDVGGGLSLYMDWMSRDYGITLTLQHHTSMIDLLGRAGHLEEAMQMVRKLPYCPDSAVWHSVLHSCRKWGNVELARQAFSHAVVNLS